MEKQETWITLNSTFLYLIAFLLTTILHEFSHALVGLIFGSQPIIHHNYVQHIADEGLSINQHVLISIVGPFFSLIQGTAVGWFYLIRKKQNLLSLFLLWFSMCGFNNFFGYLMTGPLFKQGDIGKVHLLLNFPLAVQILFALVGITFLIFIAYKLTVPFLKFSYNSQWLIDKPSKKLFAFRIIILPWLIGSICLTLLYLPVIAIVSIIYPFMSGMIFILPWKNAGRIENILLTEESGIGKFNLITIVLLIILTLCFKFILAPGIEL